MQSLARYIIKFHQAAGNLKQFQVPAAITCYCSEISHGSGV